MIVGSIPEIIHILVRGRRFDPLIFIFRNMGVGSIPSIIRIYMDGRGFDSPIIRIDMQSKTLPLSTATAL